MTNPFFRNVQFVKDTAPATEPEEREAVRWLADLAKGPSDE